MAKDLTRKQLYKLVWKKAIFQIAKEYGWSDRGIGKICEKYKIPTPSRGDWAKIKSGIKVKIPSLKPIKGVSDTKVILSNKVIHIESYNSEVEELIARESLPENQIIIPERIKQYHPLIKLHSKRASTEVAKRRNKLFSILSFALEDRGFEIEDIDMSFTFKAKHEQEHIYIELDERVVKHKRPLTEKEEKKKLYVNQKWAYDIEQTGSLKLSLYKYLGYYGPTRLNSFRDKKERPIESVLQEVLIEILKYVYTRKEERIREEKRQRRHQEELERRERELARREQLLKEVSSWDKAETIRAYVNAITRAYNQGELQRRDFDEWKTWALDFADMLDPIK